MSNLVLNIIKGILAVPLIAVLIIGIIFLGLGIMKAYDHLFFYVSDICIIAVDIIFLILLFRVKEKKIDPRKEVK